MGAADNPVGHDNRLGSGLGVKCQHFFRHPDVVADVGLLFREPASKVGCLGVLGRHNADRELGGRVIVRTVETLPPLNVRARASPAQRILGSGRQLRSAICRARRMQVR
jgi:hypothetical protein